MKKLILVLISVLLANIGMAQTRITGRVTSSDDGMPIPGATETSNYYSSLSYTKEQGRIYINEFDRITGRLNMSQKVGKLLEFSTNVNFARSNRSGFNDTRNLGGNYYQQTRNLLWGLYWPTSYLTGDPWTLRYGSYAYSSSANCSHGRCSHRKRILLGEHNALNAVKGRIQL